MQTLTVGGGSLWMACIGSIFWDKSKTHIVSPTSGRGRIQGVNE